jgi:hypothetical protein
VGAIAVGPSASADDGATLSYSGLASALGVRLTVTVANAPLTNTPIDSGGPTAQAQADSLGLSRGYAALPDPGQFIVSIPDLGNGLLSGGAAGLPPIALGTAPPYPLFVSSDGASRPEQSFGAGPYALAARSGPDNTTAMAIGGLRSDVSGNAALVRSDAAITKVAGQVISTATSDLQGLTVGPLSIGAIKSTAAMSLVGNAVTPTSSVTITGMTIGSVPVAFSGNDLNAFGQQTPVPLNSSLAEVLKSAGITVQVIPAVTEKDRIYAPAVQITAPFDVSGQGRGTFTMTIGGGLAGLVGSAASAAPAAFASPESSSGAAAAPVGTDVAAGPGSPVVFPPAFVPTTQALQVQPVAMTPAAAEGSIGSFDLRLLYFVLALGGGVALGASALARVKW